MLAMAVRREREGEILIGAGELGRDGKVQRMVQVGRWLSGGDHPRATRYLGIV